jgi:DNA repair exonuclease SbcCD ATPase subunit
VEESEKSYKNLSKELSEQRQQMTQVEAQFADKLKTIHEEKTSILNQFDELTLKSAAISQFYAETKKKLEISLRKTDNLEAQLQLRPLEDIRRIKAELSEALKQNQKLKDQIQTMRLTDRPSSAEHSDINDAHLDAQQKALRAKLRKAKNDLNQAVEKSARMEAQWKEEFERRTQLQALAERASRRHGELTEASRHKYDSLLSLCNKLEAYVFQLLNKQAELNEAEGKPLYVPTNNLPSDIVSYDDRSRLPVQLAVDLFSPSHHRPSLSESAAANASTELPSPLVPQRPTTIESRKQLSHADGNDTHFTRMRPLSESNDT